jgi:hypothetical protein
MAETEIQITRIHGKLQRLLKLHSVLQKENGQLKEELHSAQKQAAVQYEKLDMLKQQVDILKYSNGEMSGADKKEFEKRINSYVKEIDRCIAMLSQ